jgi:hypothetical protein
VNSVDPCINLIVLGLAGSDGVQMISKFEPASTASLLVGVTNTSNPGTAFWARANGYKHSINDKAEGPAAARRDIECCILGS